jgi:hypothetical protein
MLGRGIKGVGIAVYEYIVILLNIKLFFLAWTFSTPSDEGKSGEINNRNINWI